MVGLPLTTRRASELVGFASEDGARLFRTTPAELIRWDVLESFVPQENPYYCGVACLTTVLRAAGLRSPQLVGQDDLLSSPTMRARDKVLNLSPGDYPGLAIEDARDILGHYFMDVDLSYGTALSETALAEMIVASLADRTAHVLANFDGREMGLDSVGHFAALGAFHPGEGRVLVLDPAAYKRGWFWVRVAELWRALQPLRELNGRSRGMLATKGGWRGPR